MDPVSISASVITLIQATNGVIHLCFDYASSVKGAKPAISGLLDELKSLRNILESLGQLLATTENPEQASTILLKEVATLCNREDGPIAKEMKHLDEKLRIPDWAGQDGSRRRALMQSLTWPLKEGDTRKILEKIERLKKNLELALSVDQSARMRQLQQGQESLKSSMKSLHNDERYKKIVIWLAAPNVSLNFNAALGKRHANSGLWLLQTPQFQSWKAAQASFLWLHGIPGCGKTVLSATIIDSLAQEEEINSAVAYFFFDFNDSAKQHVDNMLRSLVLQIISNFESIPNSIDSLFRSCQEGAKSPQTKDLVRVFKDLAVSENKLFVVLDGLDECEDREDLLLFLKSAIGWRANGLTMLMTSRRLREFDDLFGDNLREESKISIQNEEVDNDIRSYIRGKLLDDRRLKRWQKQPRVQEEIEERLMEKSEGMFRWAACQIDALSSCISVSKLREALNSLPTTLDETYDRILCKIEPLYKPEALQILQWLTCTLRPLSLEEVAELVAVNIGEDKVFDIDKRPSYPDDVLDICSSLVICVDANGDKNKAVPPKKRLVRLAHFSVKEYLVSDRIRAGSAAYFGIEERLSHATIGQTSLSCLLMYEPTSHTDSKGFLETMRLAKYAAESWVYHVLKSGGIVPYAAVDLLLSEEKMRIWTDLHNLDFEILGRHRKVPEHPGSPVYYAVLTRLEGLVHSLISLDEDKSQGTGTNDGIIAKGQETVDTLAASHKKSILNITGGLLHTPLQAAAWLGEQDIVELLLKRGADPNIYGGSVVGSALSAAARNDHFSIAKLLLREGADICEGLSTSWDNLGRLGLDDVNTNRRPSRAMTESLYKMTLTLTDH